MPATLREVSQKLNLSPGLVSRVLNNRPGVRATPETVDRIRRFAAELNYEPSAAAKSLREGKTRVVGFISTATSDKPDKMTYGEAAEGLSESLVDIDYSLLIKVVPGPDNFEDALKAMVRQRVCDAMVLWGDEPIVERQGELLEELRMPFAVKGRHEVRHPNWVQVDYDHEAMMAACVRYLADAGHRNIAFMGFDPQRLFQRRIIAGYVDEMTARFGADIPDEWLATVAPGIEEAEYVLTSWLELPEAIRPTAVVVGSSNNPMWGIERGLARVGRRLGFGPGMFAAGGMIRPETPLLFGEAVGYAESNIRALSYVQADQLKSMLDDGSVPNRIARLLPELKPLLSLSLHEVTQLP